VAFADWLAKHKAEPSIIQCVGDMTPQAAWRACGRPDRMLWLLAKTTWKENTRRRQKVEDLSARWVGRVRVEAVRNSGKELVAEAARYSEVLIEHETECEREIWTAFHIVEMVAGAIAEREKPDGSWGSNFNAYCAAYAQMADDVRREWPCVPKPCRRLGGYT